MSDPTTITADGEAVEYRDVPGFPGYRVGDDGSVWSRWRRVGLGGGRGSRAVLSDEWRRLKTSPRQAYPTVTLYCDGAKRRLGVHQLVMLAFVGPCPEGKEVAHENGIPADCRLGNLAYKTHSANALDRNRHESDPRGEKNPHAKLNDEQVRAIRAEYAAGGITYRRIGLRYGVSESAIHLVVKGTRWGHV